MIVDARTIASGTTLQADLCIVGAGAAGITIAREFLDHPAEVIVLESGGTTVRDENQSLYEGEVTGPQYPSLDKCRRRIVGGSSSFWGGWCCPLDDCDFKERDWVSHSGWPFTRDSLQDEYARAHRICKIGDYAADRDATLAEDHEQLVNPAQKSFEDIQFQVNPINFGEVYRPELEKSGNIDLFLHANVLEIRMDGEHRTAQSVRVATFGGNDFTVSARNFVLAAGGIENPRILLASRGSGSTGVGNENDLVGRFFADHMHLELRTVALNGRPAPPFYRLRKNGVSALRGGMALTEEVRRRDRLLGFAVTIHNADDPHDVVYPSEKNPGYTSLKAIAKPLLAGEMPDRIGFHLKRALRHVDNAANVSYRKFVKPRWRAMLVGCRAEQAPNSESRVVLERERDALGMNKVRLDWRLTEQDLDSMRRARQILDREWVFAGAIPDEKPTERPLNITAAAHHMGTTRMHRDPKAGVVDEMCRVHGAGNLYVAGSSVFPTSGWAPPTLTIVALAVRLADYLKRSHS